MSLFDDAVAELSRWSPPTAEQARLRASYLSFLAAHPDGLSRDCRPDHVTGSLLVLSEQRDRVLLNLHGKHGIWVQFGGHCDPTDETLAGTALREGREESGIAELRLVSPQPVQLSRHEVRCGQLRLAHHLDVRYVALAAQDACPVVSAESLEVRWFPVDALPRELDSDVVDLVAIGRAL